MDDDIPEFTKNKRLVDESDGSHVGGGLSKKNLDLTMQSPKLNKQGLDIVFD